MGASGAAGLCPLGLGGPASRRPTAGLLSLDVAVPALNHELIANVWLLSPTNTFQEAHREEMRVLYMV